MAGIRIQRIQLKRDTNANWIANNPILTMGEPAYVTDTGVFKIGNGSDTFTNLPVTNISQVIIDQLQPLLDSISDVLDVSNNLDDIDIIKQNLLEIDRVGTNINAILTVESNITEIESIYGQLNNLVSLAQNLQKLLNIEQNLTDVVAVGQITTEIKTIVENIDEFLAIQDYIPIVSDLFEDTQAERIKAEEAASDSKKHAQETTSFQDTDGISFDKGAKGYSEDAEQSANAASTSETNASNDADSASTSKTNALISENKAEEWAEKDEDLEIEIGQYSAKHHAIKSSDSAISSETSRQASETAQGLSEDAKVASETARDVTEGYRDTTEGYKNLTETAKTGAETAETKAQKWADEDQDVEVETGLYSAKHWAFETQDTLAEKADLDYYGYVPISQINPAVRSTKVVADITARDAIPVGERYEGYRVHVLDASADSTVTSDSAGYILKSGLTNIDWEKTYESESLDLDDTDDIAEGVTNLYFTDERAVTAIKADPDWNAIDWDIAFGWGDHSQAGYLLNITQEEIGDLSNIDANNPSIKEILEYNGTNYVSKISPDYKEVYNFTGTTIPKGTIITISGSAGAVPLITIADKDTDNNVAGITIEDIDPSTTGLIQLQGTIDESFINTFGMTAGNTLYLGNNGVYTDTRPSTGNIIKIGKIGVIAPSNGTLLLDMPSARSDANDIRSGTFSYDVLPFSLDTDINELIFETP